MATQAIPERVYTLCKIVEKSGMSSSEVKEKMEPSYLKQDSSYFGYYRLAAEELQLISTTDNIITLIVDPSVIKTMESMRRYCNKQLDRFREGPFYKVTKIYFELGNRVLHGEQNVANMVPVMYQNGVSVDSMEMRAWRFWASYLGFGYLQGMFLMPNVDVFLSDLIETSGLEKNYSYTVSQFLEKIRPHSDIIIDPTNPEKSFNFGVSNGFRTLQNQGLIKMENIMDQGETWNLYHIDALSTNETVTNITIIK